MLEGYAAREEVGDVPLMSCSRCSLSRRSTPVAGLLLFAVFGSSAWLGALKVAAF